MRKCPACYDTINPITMTCPTCKRGLDDTLANDGPTPPKIYSTEFTLDTGGREHPVIHYVQDESTKETQ